MVDNKYFKKYKAEIDSVKALYESGRKGEAMALASDVIQSIMFDKTIDEIPSRKDCNHEN